MPTHLIIVVLDGKYKVAQLSEQLGTPAHGGLRILHELCDIAAMQYGWYDLTNNLKETTFHDVTDTDLRVRFDSWRAYWAADALHAIRACPQKLVSNLELASDARLCFWVYVVDMDNGVFEVYGGPRQSSTPDDRFGALTAPDGYGNYPLRRLAKFELVELPDDDAFLEACLAGIPED